VSLSQTPTLHFGCWAISSMKFKLSNIIFAEENTRVKAIQAPRSPGSTALECHQLPETYFLKVHWNAAANDEDTAASATLTPDGAF
jgi:hypothetical protein